MCVKKKKSESLDYRDYLIRVGGGDSLLAWQNA